MYNIISTERSQHDMTKTGFYGRISQSTHVHEEVSIELLVNLIFVKNYLYWLSCRSEQIIRFCTNSRTNLPTPIQIAPECMSLYRSDIPVQVTDNDTGSADTRFSLFILYYFSLALFVFSSTKRLYNVEYTGVISLFLQLRIILTMLIDIYLLSLRQVGNRLPIGILSIKRAVYN